MQLFQPGRSAAWLCSIILFLSPCLSDAYSFLFFSSPSTGTINFARILTAVEHSQSTRMSSKKLMGVESIQEPRGLAVDSLRKILYVIDGNAGTLYAARIYHSNDGNVACEAPVKIADNLASHWVAVDFRGKVFFVSGNQILSAPASVITSKLDGTTVVSDSAQGSTIITGNAQSNPVLKDGYKIVYDGDSVANVNVPHGIAVDGHRLFWSNGENGKQDGTVVSGLEEPPMGSTAVTKVATNLAKAFGVCLTPQRIFYTDAEANLFSTKVNGGPVTTVATQLQKPRGCVFDGDGTVFVADAGANQILSFAGAGAELGARKLSVALGNVASPFGLAVLIGNHDALHSGASHITMVAAITAVVIGFAY